MRLVFINCKGGTNGNSSQALLTIVLKKGSKAGVVDKFLPGRTRIIVAVHGTNAIPEELTLLIVFAVIFYSFYHVYSLFL